MTGNTSLATTKKNEAVDVNKSDICLVQEGTLQMKVCAICRKILNPGNK